MPARGPSSHHCGEGKALVALEILHCTLMLLGRRTGRKRPEIAAASGLRILLARIEAIFARLELADHGTSPAASAPDPPPRQYRLAIGSSSAGKSVMTRQPLSVTTTSSSMRAAE